MPIYKSDGSKHLPQEGGLAPGSKLGHKYMLLYVKADWAEHVKTFGLSSWGCLMHPCQYCHCTKDAGEPQMDTTVSR